MSTATLTRTVSASASAGAGPDPWCTAPRHGTQRAYRVAKCRCTTAVRAHTEYRQRQKARQATTRNDRAPRDPACPGRIHPASLVGWRAGCRCPDTWDAYEAAQQRAAVRAMRAARDELERVTRDLDRWRGPSTRVDLLNVEHLAAGYETPATYREVWLADRLVRRRGLALDAVATWLGVPAATITRSGEYVRRARQERTERRAAEARWRVARNAWVTARDEVRLLDRAHALAGAERALAAAEREALAARQASPYDRTRRRLADARRRAARNDLLALRRAVFGMPNPVD